MTNLAFVDGELIPRAEASISIDDAAVRYGAACFETMLAANGRVFRLGAHLARLRAGLDALGVSPVEESTLTRAVARTLEANALSEARVRLSVSPGALTGPDLATASAPSVVVVVDPIDPAAVPPEPLRLAVASQRVDPSRPLAFAKHAHYLVYLLARAEARAQGASDALLLNTRDEVCEAATANLFAVIDGVLVTPSLDAGPIPGVTRAAFLEGAAAEGVSAIERRLSLDELVQASELFTTSSVVGARPVAAVERDGVRLWTGDAPGPITERLSGRYASLVAAETRAQAG